MFLDDAKALRGPQGCRTEVELEPPAPWVNNVYNCASLVGVFGTRAVVIANGATYMVEASKIRLLRFNALPDRSVIATVGGSRAH